MTVLRIIFLGDGCERVSGATFAFPGPQRSSRNEREGSTGANLVCPPCTLYPALIFCVSLGKADASQGQVQGLLRGSQGLMHFCSASKTKNARLDDRFRHLCKQMHLLR